MINRRRGGLVLIRWWLVAALLGLGALFIAIIFTGANRPSVFSMDGFTLPAILLTFVLMVIPTPWGVARLAVTTGASIVLGAGFLYLALNSTKTRDVVEATIGVALELAVFFTATRLFRAQQVLNHDDAMTE